MSAEKIDILIDLNRLDEAERRIRLGLASQPENSDFLLLLVRIHLARNDDAEALKVAQQALGLDPHNEWGFRLAAVAAMNLDSMNQAIDYAAEAVRLYPYYASFFLQSKVYAAAGNSAAEKSGRKLCYDAALESAQAALKDDAEHIGSLLMIAEIRFLDGEHDEARSYIERALAIDPESADGRSLLGRLSEESGDYEEAVGHYMSAGKIDPTDGYPRERIHSMFLGARNRKFLFSVIGASSGFALWVNATAGFSLAIGVWFCIFFLAPLGPKYMIWRKLPKDVRAFSGSFLFPKDKEGKTDYSIFATIAVSVLPLFLVTMVDGSSGTQRPPSPSSSTRRTLFYEPDNSRIREFDPEERPSPGPRFSVPDRRTLPDGRTFPDIVVDPDREG